MTDDIPTITKSELRALWVGVGWLVIIGLFCGLLAVQAYGKSQGRDYLSVASAFGTLATAIVTALYVWFTYGLWQEAARQVRVSQRNAEAQLMQSLMLEYDGMREAVQKLNAFFDTRGIFVPGDFIAQIVTKREPETTLTRAADDARYRLSRFYVRLRKLCEADYIDRDLIRAALGPDHIRLFLHRVAPLDRLVRRDYYGTALDVSTLKPDPDEAFYGDLLKSYPPTTAQSKLEPVDWSIYGV